MRRERGKGVCGKRNEGWGKRKQKCVKKGEKEKAEI